MVQYSKFNKMARETAWRTDLSSINYIETSTWTRQEHNGFSHQNPSFIGAVLNLKPDAARVYFPPDANTFLSQSLTAFAPRTTSTSWLAPNSLSPSSSLPKKQTLTARQERQSGNSHPQTTGSTPT